MEEQKIDRRTKGFKEASNKSEGLEAYNNLKESGIALKVAVFLVAVKFLGEAPETAYYHPADKAKPHKTAMMFYTPHGILCEKKNQKMIVPLANVLYSLPL